MSKHTGILGKQPAGTPWRVLAPLGTAVCLSLFGDLSLYAVLASEADTVGLSLGAVGVMLSANRLIRIPLNPLAGLLLDRFGRRRLFVLGMALGTVSVAGFGLVRGFWPFLVTRLGWGIAWTLINVGGMTMVLDVSTPANRGRLVGIYNVFMLLGLALGPLVGGILVDTLGFRPAMLVCAGFGGMGSLVSWLLPETGARSGPPPHRDKPQPGSPRRLTIWIRQVREGTLGHPELLATFALYLITQLAGEGVVLSTVSLLLQRRLGESISVAGGALGVATLSGTILALRSILAGLVGPVAGQLSDSSASRRPWIVASLVLGMVSFIVLALAATLPVMIAGVALSAVSGGIGLAALTAQIGDQTPPGREGVAMGAYATAGDIGSTAGPLLAFGLVQVAGLSWVYVICALAFVVGGLGLALMNGRFRRRQDPADQPA